MAVFCLADSDRRLELRAITLFTPDCMLTSITVYLLYSFSPLQIRLFSDDAEFLKNKDGEDAGCVIDDSHPFKERYRESWWECKQGYIFLRKIYPLVSFSL